jgi:DNA-binding transcriptional regulator GbsR (MarR family)
MPDQYYEEKHFIEDISLFFEQMGLPRIAGRILGVLLISDPPEQSINDLCEVLQTSKSSISTNTRLLTETGLIERAASPIPRRIYFRFKPGGWLVFMRQRMKLISEIHQIAERGLEMLRDRGPDLRERLQEAHDVFSMYEEHFTALLERFESQYMANRG